MFDALLEVLIWWKKPFAPWREDDKWGYCILRLWTNTTISGLKCSCLLGAPLNRCLTAHTDGKMIVYNYVLSIHFIYTNYKKENTELHHDTTSTIRLYSHVVYTNRTKIFSVVFPLWVMYSVDATDPPSVCERQTSAGGMWPTELTERENASGWTQTEIISDSWSYFDRILKKEEDSKSHSTLHTSLCGAFVAACFSFNRERLAAVLHHIDAAPSFSWI